LVKRLGGYLPKEEYRKVTEINSRVHQVFGRRFTNKEELYLPRRDQQRIIVITPVYNAEKYIESCIQSVISQDYDNYHMYIIDDASTDSTYELACKYANEHVTVIHNQQNRGAVYNQITTITANCFEDDIIMLLDGDDSLVNNNQIFHYYNNLYDGSTEFTYGSCWSLADNIPLVAQHYPEEVKQRRAYRQHKFNWNMPYTHLRTFLGRLLTDISEDNFKDNQGDWYRAGGDGSVFYALIEQADPNKVKAVSDIVVNYNDKNPLNDYKINSAEQTRNANEIVGSKEIKTKKILIAIPTARNIEAATFKSIYDLAVPEGYTTEFQFFYGYRVDQVRNLIASWAERYDYLFSVDSDIVFAADTLVKLLGHGQDIVSGLYIQRKSGQHTLEIYKGNDRGGVTNIPYAEIKGQGLVEIQACGFGCVLIKSQVFRDVGYPYFEYYVALDHKDTISEDVDFCRKARNKGYKLYADTTILCEHLGTTTFKVE
jgi:glycosyltransferase involved in cell wall biosynthesis